LEFSPPLAVKPKTAHDIIAGAGRVGKSLGASFLVAQGPSPMTARLTIGYNGDRGSKPSRALGLEQRILLFQTLMYLLLSSF
jgi:hypothetical protein